MSCGPFPTLAVDDGTISAPLPFVDEEGTLHAPEELLPGDRIVSVSNVPVSSLSELLAALQKRQVELIVDRSSPHRDVVDADAALIARLDILATACGRASSDLHLYALPLKGNSLGIHISDLAVRDNPSPFALGERALRHTYRLLMLLFLGKWHLRTPGELLGRGQFLYQGLPGDPLLVGDF